MSGVNSPVDPARCPLCGGPNGCQLAAGAASNAQCWCATKRFPSELLARVPEYARRRACICQRCWSEAVQNRPDPHQAVAH
ncbi:MAG: cysteine-rich CWC family protein [Limisphaerales bacterium]